MTSHYLNEGWPSLLTHIYALLGVNELSVICRWPRYQLHKEILIGRHEPKPRLCFITSCRRAHSLAVVILVNEHISPTPLELNPQTQRLIFNVIWFLCIKTDNCYTNADTKCKLMTQNIRYLRVNILMILLSFVCKSYGINTDNFTYQLLRDVNWLRCVIILSKKEFYT